MIIVYLNGIFVSDLFDHFTRFYLETCWVPQGRYVGFFLEKNSEQFDEPHLAKFKLNYNDDKCCRDINELSKGLLMMKRSP